MKTCTSSANCRSTDPVQHKEPDRSGGEERELRPAGCPIEDPSWCRRARTCRQSNHSSPNGASTPPETHPPHARTASFCRAAYPVKQPPPLCLCVSRISPVG